MKSASSCSDDLDVDGCWWSATRNDRPGRDSSAPGRPACENGGSMKKHERRPAPERVDEDMADEYDFSSAVRGATARAYAEGSNVVMLDADVAEAFPDAAAVNTALRMLARLAEKTARSPRTKRDVK